MDILPIPIPHLQRKWTHSFRIVRSSAIIWICSAFSAPLSNQSVSAFGAASPMLKIYSVVVYVIGWG